MIELRRLRPGGQMTISDCQRSSCVSACKNKPGWFLPGEAEKAADLLGLSFPEFFSQYLMVDWWERWYNNDCEGLDIFVLSPGLAGEESGTEAPGDPRGQCVFLKGGLCSIHAAKSHECRMHIHTETSQEISIRKESITAAWVEQQDYIRQLLGRDPQSKEYQGGGLMGFFS